MKSVKIFALIVGGIVVLVLISAFLVSLLVNPNDFKPKIAAAVKDSTGRELNLQGDIKLHVFPRVALTLGPASLGNPPGFGDAPFLSFNRAEVRVKLVPLLSKHLEVARVVLDGLDLRLVKKLDGQANWQMNEKKETPKKQSPESGGGPSIESIAGITVTHGRVSYNQYVIENLDFETGAISGKRGDLRVAALNVKWTVARPTSARLNCEISAPQLEANLDKQTLSLPEFSMVLGAAKVTGKLSGTKIVDDLHLSGSIALAPLMLKDFVANFGIALPKTQDVNALSSLSAGTGFSYDADGATLDHLKIKLDDTTLEGEIQLTTAKTESMKFKLAADRINLDRYRPPPNSTPDPKSAAANQPMPKAPADESEPMTAEGTFTLAAAHAAGLDFTNLIVTVDMKDNITHLHPLEAQLYGGKYSGDLTYDARTAAPSISMDEQLSSVDVAELLANTKAKGRVSGKANVNIKGTARGAGADDIMKTLNGHFDANLANGAVEGMDVGYELALAQALINRQPGTSTPNTHKTAFDVFETSAQITNGIAVTKDLVISSAVLKVAGQGTIDLPTSGIEMTLVVSVMKSAASTAVDIPLNVTGTYTNPSVKPDLTALAKDELKQKAQDLLKKNGIDLNSLFKKK
jgi:AsmA protein